MDYYITVENNIGFMASTKTSKYIVLPIDKMQKIGQVAAKGEMKFSSALEIIVDYGLREYERRTGGEVRA
jgi:hypothetical protein